MRRSNRRLQQSAQRLDEARARLARALRLALDTRAVRREALAGRLRRASPLATVGPRRAGLQAQELRLAHAVRQRLASVRGRLDTTARALDAVSPLATLARGYALVSVAPGGALVRDPAQVHPGERLDIRVARGALSARVIDPAADS